MRLDQTKAKSPIRILFHARESGLSSKENIMRTEKIQWRAVTDILPLLLAHSRHFQLSLSFVRLFINDLSFDLWLRQYYFCHDFDLKMAAGSAVLYLCRGCWSSYASQCVLRVRKARLLLGGEWFSIQWPFIKRAIKLCTLLQKKMIYKQFPIKKSNNN